MTEQLHFHFSLALEKEMATHSSVLTWRIPGTGLPGGLPSMGSHKVGHDCSDLAATAAGKSVNHSAQGMCALKRAWSVDLLGRLSSQVPPMAWFTFANVAPCLKIFLFTVLK